MSLLKVHHLSIAFSPFLTHTIENISFSINAGECLAIVGESGSGKSLTVRAINQCLPPNARIHSNSDILFDDQALTTLSERAMQKLRGGQISYINQAAQSAFNPVQTIGHQIHETLKTHTKLKKQARRNRILELFKEVGLSDPEQVLCAYPHELSGGMLQRALIACAIAPNPKLLIADEPTTALDVTLQTQLISLLNRLRKDYQMTMIFITHNLLLVPKIADHILILQQGKMVEYEAVNIFMNGPKHPYSQALLNAAKPNLPFRTAKEGAILYQSQDLSVPTPRRHWWQTPKRPYLISNINLTIKAGQTLAIVGESGAGKTTLIRALLGLLSYKGTLTWEGTPHDHGTHPRRQQMLFQNPYAALNPQLTLEMSLDEACRAAKIPKNHWHQTQQDALHDVALDPSLLHRYPHTLSGGQRQRFCLARVLILNPKLLCLDEPTSALDVSVQVKILALLSNLQKKRQCSYLLITHDWLVVRALADDVMVLKQGKVVEQGPVKQIMSAPQHPYTQILLETCLYEKSLSI
jgi:ABC-type microcin C transport system duplicated ATPase subunit YejF